MKKLAAMSLGTLIAVGMGGAMLPDTVGAAGFNPMNMMNPSKWMGGNKNRRYDDDYYDGGPGYGGYPPPGYGGYGGYPGGYGAPGYGAPGYGYPQGPAQQPAYAAPAAPSGGSSEQIRVLEDRIRQLESQQQSAPPAYGGGYPSAGGGYPSAGGGYPSAGGGYPPAGGGYPSAGGGQPQGGMGGMYPSHSSPGGGYQAPPSGGGYQQNPAFRPIN